MREEDDGHPEELEEVRTFEEIRIEGSMRPGRAALLLLHGVDTFERVHNRRVSRLYITLYDTNVRCEAFYNEMRDGP